MYEGMKFKLGICAVFVIILGGVLGDMMFASQVLGESQTTMRNSDRHSKDLTEHELQLSSEFFEKVKALDSYELRKQALVNKYINLSLKSEKMQVVLRELESASVALSADSRENTLMLEHRKIVSERQFVWERILEGLLRQYQLLESLETLQSHAHSKAPASSDNTAEIRWVKGELRQLEETENWNWMLLKMRESLHYLRTDITKELDLLRRK